MTIETCRRCQGCGYIVGTSTWEMPWKAWAGSQENADSSPVVGLYRPRVCPACEGSGAWMLTGRIPSRLLEEI